MSGVQEGDFQKTIVVPAWSEWPRLLLSNRNRSPATGANLGIADIQALRQRMLAASGEFVQQLHDMADERGIPLRKPVRDGLPTDRRVAGHGLIMTGHQPTIFHAGLIYKYWAAERLAEDVDAQAIAVLMDTDVGDAGQFLVPVPAQLAKADTDIARSDWPVIATQRVSLTSGGPLFAGHTMRSASELSEMTERVEQQLQQCELREAVDHFRPFASTYRRLADCPAVMANSIARRAHGLTTGLGELPLSVMCQFPEIQQFLRNLAVDGMTFHVCYNDCLDRWRKQQRITNPANPFPNLDRQGQLAELPLWYVQLETGERNAVWCEAADDGVHLIVNGRRIARHSVDHASPNPLMPASGQLVPRGALITTLFRLICCDLFVHGLGGQSYDPFTDQLIQAYFGVAPPAYTVASASRYLFQSARQRLHQLDELSSQQRQLVHRPEEFLGQGRFSGQLEHDLSGLIERKQQLVDTLKSKRQQSISAAAEGRELQTLQGQIKSLISAEFADALQQLDRLSPTARHAIEARDYPWFFFAWNG